MSDKIHDTLFEKFNLTNSKLERYFLLLGLVGLCTTSVVLLLDWVIYPNYILALLAGEWSYSIRSELNSLGLLHLFDAVNLVLIGLGFFSLFSKYEMKEKYLFLILYLFPVYDPFFFTPFPYGGYLVFDLQYYEMVDYLRVVFTTIIASYILFNSRYKIPNTKVVIYASLMLALTKIVPLAQYFISSPLRLHYDEVLHQVVGTLVGPLSIIGLSQIPAILCIIFGSVLFIRELKTVGNQSETPTEFDELLTKPVHN